MFLQARNMKTSPPPSKNPHTSFSKFLTHFNVSSLKEVRFAHRINERGKLKAFLASDRHIAEGDIMLDERTIPVMRHPHSKNPGELTFYEWIDTILADKIKGAKLDIKEGGAGEYILQYLKKVLAPEQQQRVIVNASILRGPSGGLPKIAPHFFEEVRALFPEIILCLGFTTKHRPNQQLSYTEEMIGEMLATIENLTPPLIVALRAEHMLDSPKEVIRKLIKNQEITFTLWSNMYPHLIKKYSYANEKELLNNLLAPFAGRAFVEIFNKNFKPIPIREP